MTGQTFQKSHLLFNKAKTLSISLISIRLIFLNIQNYNNSTNGFFLQSAGIGGCSHLVNFQGTDTIAGIMTARTYYGCEIAGFSIPAAEHRFV